MHKSALLFLCSVLVSAASFTISAGPGQTFTPAEITVKVGDIITWNGTLSIHSVTQVGFAAAGDCSKVNGGFDSGNFAAPATYMYTATSPGDVFYVCTIHCSGGMRGVVHILNSTTASTASIRNSGVIVSASAWLPAALGLVFNL